MSTRSGFNERGIRTTTVNGKQLQQHEGFKADDSATARELLGNEEGIVRVNLSRHSMDVYFRKADTVGWEVPDGYEVDAISTFHDTDEWGDASATIVRIKRSDE
jgi:hypothetical protein